MLFAFAYSVLRLLLDIFDVRLRVRDPEAELLLLRHQLRVVRRQVKRPQLDMADRTIMAALSRRLGRASLVGMLVQPEAVIGSHRELVRRKWAAFSRRRGPGRPAGSRCVERSPRPGSAILALGAQGATELQEA
ncbi:MAG: integrase [Chloroflexi bacterium]|nr:MAG: integrase [Chloroflexota bacterium]TMF90559.1 MAG: integrase [Chloroflexota bacterium]TMG43464.1 MAG: integrase [Chloroflexota bacterium]